MLRRWMNRNARPGNPPLGSGKKRLAHNDRTGFGAVRSQVDDSAGWQSISSRQHDRDWGAVQELYTDALTAWRKNPFAWRIVSIVTDYVVGEAITLSSPLPELDRFIQAFWNHPQNRMSLRLEDMCAELSRAGDLFVTLHRNPLDGMSYIRFITKDQILRIETAPNDWETETCYFVSSPGLLAGGQLEPVRWASPAAGDASQLDAIMLHYAVNRPIGALLGESDLTTMIPWLLRYSRMLEDRVRLHWAARAFLYLVTVPTGKVEAKVAQYSTPPESGSIVVKDESEKWETLTPVLRGADASHDLKAVRGMIDAGAGFPPHWRGEGADVNLATAEAMQVPTEKHLLKRQQYFVYLLQDILYHAYQRCAALGFASPLPSTAYSQLFTAQVPDITKRDNVLLADAAQKMTAALSGLRSIVGDSPEYRRLAAALVLRFAGEPQSEAILNQIGRKEA